MAPEHLSLPARAFLRPPLAVLLACALAQAGAAEFKASGRLTVGAVVRTEAPDPRLLVAVNAPARGLPAIAPAGQNSDDANNNYERGDVVSRALKGYIDLSATSGTASALVRIKGWHDDGLLHDPRPWGNSPNGFSAGAPLSDAGAARLGRFSGLALGDLWVQDTLAFGRWRLLGRAGRQSLSWGERSNTGSGLSSLNAIDLPAARRAGATLQEMRAPQPMLFARLSREGSSLAVEGFWQSSLKPGALDTCGTFWAVTDYLADGCNLTFAGAPPASDRQRLPAGAYLKRVPSPYSLHKRQYGLAVTFRRADGLELGLYRARYINRTPTPGLRKSSRTAGPALIAGDPDGRNLAYFSAYVDGVDMLALTAQRQRPGLGWYAELTWRPNQPVQLPSSDVLAAFLNPSTPALLRLDAAAVAPGGYFLAYDRYRTAQLQLSVQKDLGRIGATRLSGSVDVVYKHAFGLPDPALRRYGRADVFGPGPVSGVCSGSGPTAPVQCSLDGYVTPDAWGYRVKLDARFGKPAPNLELAGDVTVGHEVRGWSYDLQLNEGRRTATFALRAEYRGRYLFQVAYAPVWGGRYNSQADRDQAWMMAGVRF